MEVRCKKGDTIFIGLMIKTNFTVVILMKR